MLVFDTCRQSTNGMAAARRQEMSEPVYGGG